MDIKKLKDLTAPGRIAKFTRFRKGNLWYAVHNFEFPVPIEEVGDATFKGEEKASMLRRYIRIHLKESTNNS